MACKKLLSPRDSQSNLSQAMSLERKAHLEQNAARTRRRKVQGIGIEIYQTQSNLSQAMSLGRKAHLEQNAARTRR